jgi:hypothetical protein
MNGHQVSRITGYSIGLMILTSIHHIYGAVIYHTPWRLHVLLISVPVILLTLVLNRALQQNKTNTKSFVIWLFFVVTLIPSVGLIGFYEGVYNHILKNSLFFGGVNHDILQMLFPAPKYEMPNDLLFEMTGVLQGLVVIPLAAQLTRWITSLFYPVK